MIAQINRRQRHVLSAADFAELVAGRVARLPGRRGKTQPVELLLADVGFAEMRRAIDEAEREREQSPCRET